MVFIPPSPSHVFKRLNLLKASKFFLCRVGKELAAPAFANQLVNFVHERSGITMYVRRVLVFLSPI